MKATRKTLEDMMQAQPQSEPDKPEPKRKSLSLRRRQFRQALQAEPITSEQAEQEAQQEFKDGDEVTGFINRFLRQSKQLSQLVARSWFDDEDALAIREYFVRPYNSEILNDSDGNLKRLLGAAPGDNENGPALSLLLKIFTERELPIFSRYELDKVYEFSVDLNIFEGSVNDIPGPSRTGAFVFHVVIPYPPRPALSPATVTLTELEAWVKQPILDAEGEVIFPVTPPNVYIPPTCC